MGKRLRDEIISLARSQRWPLVMQEKPIEEIVGAGINVRSWTMLFQIDPEAEERLGRMGMTTDQQNMLVRQLAAHETGHWSVCPYDRDGEEIIVDAVQEVVPQRREPGGPGLDRFSEWANFSDQNGMARIIMNFCNLVADLIVDTVQALEDSTGEYADGQALFYAKEFLRNTEREGEGSSQLFASFAWLNLILWGERTRYCEHVRQLIKNSLAARKEEDFFPYCGASSRTGIKVLPVIREVFPHHGNPAAMASWLRDSANWGGVARKITRFFLQLYPVRNNRETTWWKPSPFRNLYTYLYETRAREIPLHAQEGSVGRNDIMIAPLLNKPIDPLHMPDLQQLAWGQTFCCPTDTGAAELQLFYSEHTVKIPESPKPDPGYLPDISFWIDSSGSMEFAPLTGEGEYDILIRAIFGVFKWLNEKGYAPYINYSVLNFSDETLSSGWQSWQDRDKIDKVLFNYSGLGTSLDLIKARELIFSTDRFFIVIMITDGHIENHEELKDLIIKFNRKKYKHVLIQINASTVFADNLRASGITVYDIESHHDLIDLVISEVAGHFTYE